MIVWSRKRKVKRKRSCPKVIAHRCVCSESQEAFLKTARGEAQAIINNATAEARSIQEVRKLFSTLAHLHLRHAWLRLLVDCQKKMVKIQRSIYLLPSTLKVCWIDVWRDSASLPTQPKNSFSLSALKKIAAQKGTTVHFMPNQTAFLQTVRSLGVNAVLPTSVLKYI